MCGIVASISTDCYNKLLESLFQLQNRGYDSAGICTLSKNGFNNHKYASTDKESAIEKLKQYSSAMKGHNIGIGHTRWATHGAKTDINSHPHISSDGKIAVVHNGIIENYSILKDTLLDKGYTFVSETDTEIISNLLAYYYNEYYNVDECYSESEHLIFMKKAIEKTIQKLEGTWGLVILNINTPNTLYCTRVGSPLLIAKNGPKVIITSEQSGFNNQMNQYLILDNRDICTVTYNGFNITINSENKYDYHNVLKWQNTASPEPYPHWTIKEIHDQVDAVVRATKLGSRVLNNNTVRLGGFELYKDKLLSLTHIILLGCGTSYHSGLICMQMLKKMRLFTTVQLVDGAQFSSVDIPNEGKTGAILISQSGETKDLHRCIEIANNHKLLTIGVINVVDSLIAREVDCGCYLHAGREVGVASTKAFTSQVVVLSLIVVWFAQHKQNTNVERAQMIQDLQTLHEDIQTTIDNTIARISSILPLFDNQSSCFVLGKDMGESVAKEGALKIKEISYIHAEGYSTSSLKHGPFALLQKDFPVIIIAPENKWYAKSENAYEEIKSRGASILFITDKPQQNKEHVLYIPKNKTFGDLLCIIPLQLIAYHLSINKGFNPDMPRNLAKVVTVE
jgi:glucosamine--fructose-6-phosphate aminotransferase (isomerizing)